MPSKFVALFVANFLFSTAAQADALFDHASPGVGSTVASSPDQVALYFTQRLEPNVGGAEVRNTSGVHFDTGKVISGALMRIRVGALPTGDYTVTWRVLSVDEHATRGSFSFRVDRSHDHQDSDLPEELSAGDRPFQWCGWWMRQHLGGGYGPEFNVARNWLNVGRPLDGPRAGAIGVKAHHVFQVVRVVDQEHVLAISGNDHNAVLTRIRPTSDVIGWRDVSEEGAVGDETGAQRAMLQLRARGMASSKSDQTTNKHFATEDTVGNCSILDGPPSNTSGMRILGDKNGYSSAQDAQAALGLADCKGKIDRG